MFSVLPDLTPRDSHSLWYNSSRNPNQIPAHLDLAFLYSSGPGNEHGNLATSAASGTTPSNGPQRHPNSHNRSANQAQIIEGSILGRLRADELYMERRRANVGNLGSTWLKPPGVGKTLFQMREERREAEEHAEAMRREALAAELAEAEAVGGGVDPMALGVDDTGAGTGLGGEQIMVDEEENGEGGRDLDDDIPDADEGFGYDGISEDEEEEGEEEEETEESEETEEYEVEEETGALDDSPRRQRREEANRIGAVRATEDRMREMLATRGTASHRHHLGQTPGGGDLYGADEEIDEDQADLLEEDDLLQGRYDEGMEDDLDMDANLDDDIPEAESLGGYEHTDSEAELDSDEDDDEHEISYAGAGGSARRRISQQPQPQQFGRNPAHRISSSGLYALPPYSARQTPQQQQQQQQEYRHQRQNRNSLASRAMDRGEGGQRSSLDISGLLSRDGSSVIGSSPRMRRH